MLNGDVGLHDEMTTLYLGMDWPDPPDDEPEDDEEGES